MPTPDSYRAAYTARKKKKKKVTSAQQNIEGRGGVAPANYKPQKAAPAPRFPAPIPQKQVPQPPPSAIYGMNLKNLSQAYFEKYDTFPNAVQTYFMLENSGGSLWAKDEWGKLLAPGKSAPSPLFDEFERALRGGKGLPSKNLQMGLGVEQRDVEEDTPQLYRDRRSTAPQTSSEAAFSVNEADPKMIGRKVAPPDFNSIPLKLSELDNRVRVEVGGMDPAQIAAYSPATGNMVEWKRYWAGVKEAKGEKVGFDPDSQEWTAGLDREYHRYLWYRVLPYAMLSKNQTVKQSALKALDAIQPALLGSYSLDPTGATDLKFKNAIANVTDIIGALDDEAKKAYFFSSFSSGRVAGESDRKVLYDYVSEFGQNNLPADKIAEYRESLWTLNKIVSWPFEKATEGAKGAIEWSDFAFDKLKEQPGAWGAVGETLHTAYNKGLIESNPMTSSLIPMGIGYGHQAGATILDLIHDSVNAGGFEIDPADLPAGYGADIEAHNKRMRARESEQISMKQAFTVKEWTERWDNHAGKDMFVDLADDYLNDQGVPQDDWTRDAFRDVATVASLYITLKVAGKSDMYIRRAAIKQARKGFGALRFGEDVLRRRTWDEAGYLDLGPARKNDAGVQVKDLKLKDGTEITVDASIADDIARLNDEGFKTHQSHGLKADHPKGHDAAKMPPYVEFTTTGMTPKMAERIKDAADSTGMEIKNGIPQEIDGVKTHTVVIKGDNIHEFTKALVGKPKPENLMDAPDRMFAADEFIGEGQQAGLDMGIDTTAVKGRYEAPPQRPQEMPGQTGLDVGKPHEGRLTKEKDPLIAELEREASIILEEMPEKRGPIDIDHPATDADLLAYIKAKGGISKDNPFANDVKPVERQRMFHRTLAREGGVPIDDLAAQLVKDSPGLGITDGESLFERLQNIDTSAKPSGRARLKEIEAEIASLEAQRGAPPRTPTPEEAAPSPATAGGPQAATAATPDSPSGPPKRTGVAPSNEYQGTLQTPGDPLGIPRTPEGGPLDQQPLDTVGAGEAPPVAKPPREYSNGLPPTDPQYWHVKALMTVAEYVAKHANENSASLIRRMLNLEDEALLTEAAKAGVKKAVLDMQRTHDPEVVLSILDDLESKGVDTIDALGPAFFRAGRARTFENAFAAAEKLGPLGKPMLEAIRIMGTPIHLNRQIPFRDADYHVRNLGVSFKMGRKKMTSADLDELRSFEQRMFEADTKLARDDVLHDFERRIVENMKEDGNWDGPKGYLAFQKSILARRAFWVGHTLGPPRKEAYGSDASVPPTYRQMHAEIQSYREKAASYAEAGDDVQASFWKDLADNGETRLNEMQGAGHIYSDEAKHPGKYRLKNEKGEQVEGNGPDGYAMNEKYDKAVQFLRDMGDEQPVWAWQLKQKLTMDQLDPRFLAWYQSGKSWQAFMKLDTLIAEPFIRQWKQWTLAGLGFPIRVFAGDEFWRMPMEGINPLARAGRAQVASMRGDISRKEQRRIERLTEKGKDASEAEKAELAGLKEKARPKVPDDVLALISKEDMKLDADVLNIGSDYWQLLGPMKKGTDPDGTVIWDVPDDPRYLKRVQRDIGLFSQEPVIQMLMQTRGWTKESAAQAIRVLLISDTEAGAATRSLLQQTGRITAKEMEIATLQKRLVNPSSGAYRNLRNIIDEWVGMYLRIDASPEMRQGLKDGHINIDDLKRVVENDPGALPTVPVGTFDRAVKGGAPSWLNAGPFIYDRVTLPMMTKIGGAIRDTLFGHEYLRQMEIMRKRMPDADEALLSDQAAGRAANFVERTTYTRDATIFEDMVRNHLLFINSYRQFWQYWLTKMVTRPVTMGTLWTMAPQKEDPGLSGAFARHFGQFMPFFLQSRVAGEERTLTPAAQAGAIATPPGFGPLESLWLGWAIRNELGTDPGLLPGQASMGGSLLPANRMGLITEGLLNVNIPFIAKDDLTSHGMLTAYEKETVDVGDYAEGVGDKPLQSNLPQPLAVTVWIRDQVNEHGPEWLKDRVFGNPIAFQQLVASFAGLPPSLFVQKPPIYTAYTAERIKYSDLQMAGKPIEAAAFLQTTKYAKIVDEMRATTDVKEKIRLLEEYPWLAALHNSVYTFDPLGAIIYDDSWVRENKPEAVAKNDLREVLRNMYGGYKYDPLTGNYLDTDTNVYPGDIARRVEMPAIKAHVKDIDDLAKVAARDYATSHGIFRRKLYDDLMSDWTRRTDSYASVNKWEKEPDAPDWYRDYIVAHKDALAKDLPPGYTVHAYWHPKVYREAVAGLWKKDYQSGNWTPNDSEAKTIQRMSEVGLFDANTQALYMGKDTVTGQAAARVNKEAIAKWRTNVVDVTKAAFYDLDQTSLNRIGFNFGPEINVAIKKVRRAYYDWTSIVGTKAADGDEITYGSREYRDGRLKFYAYKDKVFGAVKGGEAFVGGAAERLMHTPFLTGPGTLKFTGDDAVDDAKLWKQYLKEAGKQKPDLKILRTLSDHFDSHFADKVSAYNAANHWVAVTGTALTMRWIMKKSYSDYYEGPGNSVYSNYGKAMVKKLEKLIQSYSEDCPTFRRDIATYGWDDANDVAGDLLEWYYH